MIKVGYSKKYIYEIINQNFNKKYKAWRKATYIIDAYTNAWFGKICRDKNGNFIVNKACGWINEDDISKNNKFVMRTTKLLTEKNKKDILCSKNKKILLFAKDKGRNKYMFLGVFSNKPTINGNKVKIIFNKISSHWP